MTTQRIELPWAYQTKPNFKGDASGNYFRYFRTRDDAEKSLQWMKRKNRWHGEIVYRPGECHQL